ncbi:Magnesium transporter MRS2/LPE10 [Penicillium paradoxum]|uniref:Magnesium transporter MRS2/LPE10 n=1 Tax=Penicillium paradoxum TaxID=176176 RepID=UPI0025497D97|nr:Magnesium transporter MRS2/LPE10 [Penicillium paradoxum]KAJ5787813.1 Magnesium transporter MRS2/LPE10 [Penicillium paradoxum]
MLSPRLSAPSASLLRFLRSQSGLPGAPSRCAYPKRLANRDKAFSTGSPKLSSWTRVDDPLGSSTLDTTLQNTQNGRPMLTRASVSPSSVPAQVQSSRHASTKSRPFLRRIFDLKRNKAPDHKKQPPPTVPGLMDEGTEGMFNIGRSISAKASNELRIRCTEFDINGDVTLVNGEFRKQELIAKYGLLPRDLRKIDSSTLPHILVRPSAILINLLHLRVLIKADRVLVFDAYGSTDSYMQSLFIYDLEGKLRQRHVQGAAQPSQSLPYEFRALEAVLISVTSGLEEEFNGVRDPVVRVLRALEEDIDRDKLRHLLIYSKKLGTFEQKARLVRDAIDDLLEADDDLAAMYLSERAIGKEREEDDHQEVEMLLESYHKVCDEIVQASGNLVTNIRNTEEVVKAILDANRNSLMLMDLKFSIGTLGLATGTLFSALYGMNLKNFIEESDFGFGGVSVICFALTGLVCSVCGVNLVWGGSSFAPLSPKRGLLGGNRNNWRADSIEPVWGSLPGENRPERIRRLKENAAQAAAQAASRNLKSAHASSQAAMQASAAASSKAPAESGKGPEKETDVRPDGAV